MRTLGAFIGNFYLLSFVLISVNCKVTRVDLNNENELDVPLVDKPKNPLGHSHILKIIQKLVADKRIHAVHAIRDPLQLQNDISTSIEGNSDAPTELELKHRVKRFSCWHSCLGPWKKKNPKINAYRYGIKNVQGPPAPAPEDGGDDGGDAEETPPKDPKDPKDGEEDESSSTTEKASDDTSPTEAPPKPSEEEGDDDDKNEEKRQVEADDDEDYEGDYELEGDEENDQNEEELQMIEEENNTLDPESSNELVI